MALDAAESSTSVVARWAYALRTCGIPRGAGSDPVTTWLVVTRACVQPMTIVSAAIAGALAARSNDFHVVYFALAAIGIVIAHAANNMINDYFDLQSGLDTSDYPRALYAPHPVLTGLISKRALVGAILATNALDAVIMVVLTVARGWAVLAFALGGLVISAGYVAPPLRLKQKGLGEPGVFVVWGPLMIGGTYFSAVGSISWEVIVATLPYGMLVMSVLMGKHIDKAPWDEEKGFGTLPVRLGEDSARRVTIGLMGGFYGAIGLLIAGGIYPVWTAIVALAAPLYWKAVTVYREPKPSEPPKDYPVWPLWFVSWAFVHSRRAGALLVCGLLLGLAFEVYL